MHTAHNKNSRFKRLFLFVNYLNADLQFQGQPSSFFCG